MQFSTKATNIELSQAIDDYLDKKLSVLDKHIDSSDESANAQIELEKTTEHHRSGDIFRAEINLHIAGKNMRVDETAGDLYSAIDSMKDGIARELTSYKKKKRTWVRRGAQRLKTILRRGN